MGVRRSVDGEHYIAIQISRSPPQHPPRAVELCHCELKREEGMWGRLGVAVVLGVVLLALIVQSVVEEPTRPRYRTRMSDAEGASTVSEEASTSGDTSSPASTNGKVALVLGATGEIGKEVVEQLVRGGEYAEVRTIGRREYPYPWLEDAQANGATSPLTQKIVDFEKLDEHTDAFQGAQEAFRKVDYDYVMESARIINAAGCDSYHLVSSVGADASSMLLYPRTKGEVERDVGALGWARYSFYRPSMLIAPNRKEQRLGETLSRPFMYLLGSWYKPIHVGTVAAVMIANEANPAGAKEAATEVRDGEKGSVERWENAQMHRFAEKLATPSAS